MKNIVRYLYFSDRKLFHILNGNIKCGFLDIVMPYITKLGGAIFTIVFPIILIVMSKAKIRLIGIESLISLSGSHLAVQILKRIVTRVRPYDILKHINTFNIKLHDYSFPSGHTTASFSIATAIALNVSFLMWPLMIIATTVGVSRVYLGVHYPSDIAVGAVLGIVSSMLVHSSVIGYFV